MDDAAESAEEEHERIREMLEETSDDGVRRLYVWNPRPQVAFGRRDLREEGYPLAVEAAEERGLAATERTVGGRAVVHSGDTVAFAVSEHANEGRSTTSNADSSARDSSQRDNARANARENIRERYCRVSDAVEAALEELDVDVDCREPEASFCPGDHSLSTESGKVAGVAQRVSDGAAVVSGVVLVDDVEATVDALDDVYRSLALEFDASTVSTLAESGCSSGVEEVMDAVEEALERSAAPPP